MKNVRHLFMNQTQTTGHTMCSYWNLSSHSFSFYLSSHLVVTQLVLVGQAKAHEVFIFKYGISFTTMTFNIASQNKQTLRQIWKMTEGSSSHLFWHLLTVSTSPVASILSNIFLIFYYSPLKMTVHCSPNYTVKPTDIKQMGWFYYWPLLKLI